jgi:hypothetical protein
MSKNKLTTIGALAHEEIREFKNGTVQLTEGGQFSQYNTLRRINKYMQGRFWDCPDPTAIFWQLSRSRVPLYAKSIDANTKNFDLIGIGKFNWFKAFIANARFKKWMREERFALTLDDTSNGIATYGSMVWKKSYDNRGDVNLDKVDLQNLVFDATVENIIDSPVVEMHYMTETQIRSRWSEQADEVIKKAKQARDGEDNDSESNDKKFQVVERWGEFKEENDDDAKYYHWIGVGEGDMEVELVKDEIDLDADGLPKEFPYYDFHGERVPGRWLAMGVVERLFGLQEQCNKLVNHNDKANEIASLLLFRTQDPNTTGNILDAVKTGQVINSQDMQQLGVDNRFISTFINQLQLIENKADELCFINDSISGETPPSGVPFRSLAVSTRAAVSTFNYIKTSIIEKMGYILQEQILPDLVKKFNKEDLIDIMEDDIDIRLYDQIKIEDGIKDFMKKKVKSGSMIIFEEDILAERARIQTELERGGRQENIKIDFKYGIKMNPAAESVDKNTMNAAIDGALGDMSANPAIVNTPLYQQKLANNGIPPFRLSPGEIQELEQTQGVELPEPPTTDKLSQLAAV